MKYKAIMLDLDDTTVPHGITSLPSQRVADAIAKAKDVIHVCIATGRPLDITLPIISHLSLSGPCVINNGTIIYDPVKKEIIHEVFLPAVSIPLIYAVCQKEKLFILAYNGKREVEYTGGPITENIMSMYIPQIDPHDIERYTDLFGHIPGIMLHKLSGWDKKYLSIEITSADASKQYGILEVARLLDLKTEEIIGVGDGYNDFPLLMACGLKIAMSNAVPELKAIADFIAPSVDEDGVAVVIEKFILGQ
jgi:hydroxymethylpyrimidine pyrophosphatase-like HAD family hydrolase